MLSERETRKLFQETFIHLLETCEAVISEANRTLLEDNLPIQDLIKLQNFAKFFGQGRGGVEQHYHHIEAIFNTHVKLIVDTDTDLWLRRGRHSIIDLADVVDTAKAKAMFENHSIDISAVYLSAYNLYEDAIDIGEDNVTNYPCKIMLDLLKLMFLVDTGANLKKLESKISKLETILGLASSVPKQNEVAGTRVPALDKIVGLAKNAMSAFGVDTAGLDAPNAESLKTTFESIKANESVKGVGAAIGNVINSDGQDNIIDTIKNYAVNSGFMEQKDVDASLSVVTSIISSLGNNQSGVEVIDDTVTDDGQGGYEE